MISWECVAGLRLEMSSWEQVAGWIGRMETHARWRLGMSRVETQDQNKVYC